MRTSFDIIGYPTANLSADPAQVMWSRRERVKDRQLKSKDYTDRTRATRIIMFQVESYVRAKKPVPGPKGIPSLNLL
ncbi:hypothetical protein HPB50_025393 [Hyalomma asiaticum]|uniref:Uncharacterized protein n=1 Tax=Hyalomma asiaticum TaxID=266040 RepID=A0ACB7TNK4_HYAAI|nr:hypothetical protein HPB50_025393 [Hyalomma asiaticum]